MAYDKITHAEVILDEYGRCPKCGASWEVGDIFDILRKQAVYSNRSDEQLRETVQRYYSPPYKFSRLVGVEHTYDHPEHYDGVSEWRCPDCKYSWYRFKQNSVGERNST